MLESQIIYKNLIQELRLNQNSYLYDPKSFGPTLRIFNFIYLLYPLFVDIVSNLSPALEVSEREIGLLLYCCFLIY